MELRGTLYVTVQRSRWTNKSRETIDLSRKLDNMTNIYAERLPATDVFYCGYTLIPNHDAEGIILLKLRFINLKATRTGMEKHVWEAAPFIFREFDGYRITQIEARELLVVPTFDDLRQILRV